MKSYHLNVFEAEEGGFWAEVVELQGCVAQGDTLDDLMQNARDAVAVFTEVMEEDGQPPPRDRFVANVELTAA